MKHRDLKEVEEIIAKGRKVVDQSRRMVREMEEYFAARGITREGCVAELRRLGGEAAVQAVEREIQEMLRQADEAVALESRRNGSGARATRRVAVRGGRI
jgi:hypothetical protein